MTKNNFFRCPKEVFYYHCIFFLLNHVSASSQRMRRRQCPRRQVALDPFWVQWIERWSGLTFTLFLWVVFSSSIWRIYKRMPRTSAWPECPERRGKASAFLAVVRSSGGSTRPFMSRSLRKCEGISNSLMFYLYIQSCISVCGMCFTINHNMLFTKCDRQQTGQIKPKCVLEGVRYATD